MFSRAMEFVDEVNLMAFDLYTPSTSGLTAPHAPLYPPGAAMFGNGSDRVRHSVDGCVTSWANAGVSREKLNVGVSFYGRSYRGTTELYSRHDGGGNHGSAVLYYDIYPRLRDNGAFDSLTAARDDETRTEYAVTNTGEGGMKQFVSFEDGRSVCDKVAYGLDGGLNGFFVW